MEGSVEGARGAGLLTRATDVAAAAAATPTPTPTTRYSSSAVATTCIASRSSARRSGVTRCSRGLVAAWSPTRKPIALG